MHVSLGFGYRVAKDRCQKLEENERCIWPKMDGFCRLKESSCILPETQSYLFTIESRYLPDSKKNRGRVKKMYIRGSGPGLSWTKSIQMRKSSTNLNAWTVDISYTYNSDSLACTASKVCSYTQGAIEFRIFADDSATKPMKGPNFYINLPVSNSLKGAASRTFLKPKVTVYPWFNNDVSSMEHTNRFKFIDSKGQSVRLKTTLVYPPSYNENTFRRYPLVILLKNGAAYVPQFDFLSVHASLTEEVFVLIINPLVFHYDSRYGFSMGPFDTMSLGCVQNKKKCIECQVCWDKNRVQLCEKDEFISRSKDCLSFRSFKGIGEIILNEILLNLIGEVKMHTNDRIMFDPPRQRITIIGFAEAAVTAFIMGLSRPDIIVNAAALSPKFSLPLTSDYKLKNAIFDRMDVLALLLENNIPLQSLYSSQKYYISHGENDDIYFPLVDTHEVTEKVIKKLKKQFRLEEGTNIMFHEFPDEELLSYPIENDLPILSSIQPLMLFFHKANGGASETYPRAIIIDDQFFADQKLFFETSFASNPPATVIPEGAAFVNGNIVNSFGHDERVDAGGIQNDQCSSLSSNQVPIVIFIGSIGKRHRMIKFVIMSNNDL